MAVCLNHEAFDDVMGHDAEHVPSTADDDDDTYQLQHITHKGPPPRKPPSPMSQLPISIVGAGISGLVLGRCLLSRGIRAAIFEKSRPSLHKNSHGITLHSRTYLPLLRVLNLDETTFKQRVAVDAPAGGEGLLTAAPGTSDADSASFRANRGRLEHLLAEGLDISWEHEVASASLGSSPVLKFTNGTEHPSAVIVGADGPHSRIRAIATADAAADAALKVLPYATYNGKRTLTAHDFEQALAPSMRHTTVLRQRVANAYLEISVSERSSAADDDDGGAVTISYTYSRPARTAEHDEHDPLFRPDRPKDGARDGPPDALFAELAGLREQLRGPFRVVFDAAAVRGDRLLNWLMRAARVPLGVGGGAAGVVLLGDAVHAEPILGGEGANLAVEDALCLADVLAGGGAAEAFYSLRGAAWEESVRESEGRLAEMHGLLRSSL